MSARRVNAGMDEGVDGPTIWIDSVGTAPRDKFIRVDYDADNQASPSLSLQVALLALSRLMPSFVIKGHVGRIVHDFEHSRIFMRLEPFDPDMHRE